MESSSLRGDIGPWARPVFGDHQSFRTTRGSISAALATVRRRKKRTMIAIVARMAEGSQIHTSSFPIMCTTAGPNPLTPGDGAPIGRHGATKAVAENGARNETP